MDFSFPIIFVFRKFSFKKQKEIFQFPLFFFFRNKQTKMTTLYDFKVKDIKGKDWDLSELKGKVRTKSKEREREI